MDKIFESTQIHPDLWAIKDVASNEASIAYLIIGDTQALLFDTGIGLKSIRQEVEKITNKPLLVVLSHWHFDHVGSAHEFDNIWAWPSAKMLKASRFGVPSKFLNPYLSSEFLQSLKVGTWEVRAFPSLNFFGSETMIDLGNHQLKVLHTPGHSDDSICLFDPKKGWLFAADTLYPGPIFLQFPESSLQDYKKSLDKLSNLEVAKIFPGHNSIQEPPLLLTEAQRLANGQITKSKTYPRLSLIV